jgi:hypothetical protein
MMSEWISVDNRLPEEGEYVLVYDGNLPLSGKPMYEIASYRSFANAATFVSGPYSLQGIKYWMPLPEPPK